MQASDAAGDEFYGIRRDATLVGHSVTVRRYASILTGANHHLNSARRSLDSSAGSRVAIPPKASTWLAAVFALLALGFAAPFTVCAQAAPHITSVSPGSGMVNDLMTITGENLCKPRKLLSQLARVLVVVVGHSEYLLPSNLAAQFERTSFWTDAEVSEKVEYVVRFYCTV